MRRLRIIICTILLATLLAAGSFYSLFVRSAWAGVSCSLPFTLTNGTIADATQVMANYNALVTCLTNAAAAGANNDITSLSGLTTPITPAQGGANTFIGSSVTVPSGNNIAVGSTLPTGYANVAGYQVIFAAIATNASAATLNVNSQGPKNLYKQSSAGPIPLTGGEIVPSQTYVAIYDGTQFEINPIPNITAGWGLSENASLTAIQINTVNPPFGYDNTCSNMTLGVSNNGTLLTVNVLAADVATIASVSHPVLCPFRDSALTAGDPSWVSITSSLSMNTNAAGATLGTLNGLPFRLWVVLFNNAGTPVLGLWQSTAFTVGTNPPFSYAPLINTLDETSLQSTTGISAAATSAGTFYTPNGTTLTTTPFRILGYLDFGSGLSTAGTYNVNPSKIQLFGPGIKRPGERLNFVKASLATGATGGTGYSNDATTRPAPANGVTVTAITVTPAALMDVFKVEGFVEVNGAGAFDTGYIYNGSTAVAVSQGPNSNTGAYMTPLPLNYTTIVTSTSMTFTLYGASSATTQCVNGVANSCVAVVGLTSWISAEEIQP